MKKRHQTQIQYINKIIQLSYSIYEIDKALEMNRRRKQLEKDEYILQDKHFDFKL